MNRKTSWTITLLLAAIVPFVTGCTQDDCNDAWTMKVGADKLALMIDNDIAIAKNRALNWQTPGKYELRCSQEQAVIANLTSGRGPEQLLQKGRDTFCDKDGTKSGLCNAFKAVSDGIKGNQNSAYDSDGIEPLLREACNEQSLGGKLDIGNPGDRGGHSRKLKEIVVKIKQIFTDKIYGNNVKLANKVCGTKSPSGVNLVAADDPDPRVAPPARPPETPGAYGTSITYTGAAKPNLPVETPPLAPAPGEVPPPPVNAGGATPAPAGH